MKSRHWIVHCLVSVVLIHSAWSYTMGAPDTACDDLVPGHDVSPQPLNTAPYNLTLSTSQLFQGDKLLLTLGTRGPAFKGFLVIARQLNNHTKAIGTFDSDKYKLLTCDQGIYNAVTHSEGNPKTSVTVEWSPPRNFEGEVQLIASFVQRFNTFWVRLPSAPLRIQKRSVPGSEKAPGSTSATTLRGQTASPSSSSIPDSTSSAKPSSPTTQPTSTDSSSEETIYSGCLKNKGCFGWPGACIQRESCKILATYRKNKNTGKFNIELMAKSDGYVAIGFSKDDEMGDDGVIECVNEDGLVKAHKSFNGPRNNNRLKKEQQDGVNEVEGSIVDDHISCSFTLDHAFTSSNLSFNLKQEKYFMFIAAGKAKLDNINYHHYGKARSKSTIPLFSAEEDGGFQSVEMDSELLVRIHGSLMIGAWIGTASCGMLLARYYKNTWAATKLFKKDLWFVWHRLFMVLTWLLTNAAFIIIFFDLQGWSKQKSQQHAILGCVTTGLCFIQPFIALLRPHPTASFRPFFNWIHWFIGNGAQIVAIVTIFYAEGLGKANLPPWMRWILVAFVAFYGLMHLIFSIQQCASEKAERKHKEIFMLREMGVNKPHRSYTHDQPKPDAPGSGCRKFLLSVYILATLLFVAVLIIMIVFAPIEDTMRIWFDWP